jgi:hypothetical protein
VNDSLSFYFKLGSILALAVLAGDLVMSAMFGWSLGFMMALIMGAASLASGILLIFAAYHWARNVRPLAIVLAVAWLPAFAVNVWSNIGVATAVRMADVQQARAQKAVYQDRRDGLASAKATLKVAEDNLRDLEAAHAWAGTVKATGLRDKLTELQAAADREAARGGCGPRCESIKREIMATQEQIGIAEQRADLTQRIAAAQKVVASFADKVAATDSGISSAANQSTLHAKLLAGFQLGSDPDATKIMIANEATGIAIALVVAILSVALGLGSVWDRLMSLARAPHRIENPLTPADCAPSSLGTQPAQPPAGHAAAPSYGLRGRTIFTAKADRLRALAAA